MKNIHKREYVIAFDSGETYKGHLSNIGNGYFAGFNNLGGEDGGPTGHATVKMRLEEGGDSNNKLVYHTEITRVHGSLPTQTEEYRDADTSPTWQPSVSPSSEPTQCIPDGHSCHNKDSGELIPCCSSEHTCVRLQLLGSARCITTDPPTKLPSISPSMKPSSVPTESLSESPSSTPSLQPSSSPTVSVSPSFAPTAIHSARPSSEPTQCTPDGHSCGNEENGRLVPCCSPMHACVLLPGIGSARCITTEPPTTSPSSRPSLQPSMVHSASPSVSMGPSMLPSASPSVSASPTTEFPTESPSSMPSSPQPSAEPSASPTVSSIPTITCVHCSNDPSTPMALNNRTCEEWRLTERKCSEQTPHWKKNKSCKRSCYWAGHPHDSDICCAN